MIDTPEGNRETIDLPIGSIVIEKLLEVGTGLLIFF